MGGVKGLQHRELVQALLDTQDAAVLEALADEVARLRTPEAAPALLQRLVGARVHDDPDVEDAVCSALVELGHMERLGNLSFRFIIDSAETIPGWDRLSSYLPRKYF